MENIKSLFQAVAVILLFVVAYAAFWVLVIALVGYVLYHVIMTLKEDSTEPPK
jgi:hypothetical protein